jgi:hypothetical protein
MMLAVPLVAVEPTEQSARWYLEQTAAAYEGLSEYHLFIRKLDRDAGTGHTTKITHELAHRSPDLFFMNRNFAGKKGLAVGDGENFYMCVDRINQCREDIFKRRDGTYRRPYTINNFLQPAWNSIDRYKVLATRPQQEPEIVGEKTWKTPQGKRPIVMIRTKAPEGPRGMWEETLWIDKETFLIYQSVTRGFKQRLRPDQPPIIAPTTIEFRYEWITPSAPIDMGLFVFKLPKGYEVVEEFDFSKNFQPYTRRIPTLRTGPSWPH